MSYLNGILKLAFALWAAGQLPAATRALYQEVADTWAHPVSLGKFNRMLTKE